MTNLSCFSTQATKSHNSNSVYSTLKKHTDRIGSNQVLCDDLISELGIGLLPPLPDIITIRSLPQQASAMPTAWVRTSLFVNLPQTKVQYLREKILESIDDKKIVFTGEQLNMFDNDVFLEAIRLAQSRAPNEKIHFRRSDFLRAMGLSDGKKNYEALRISLRKLKANTIEIADRKDWGMFSLIGGISSAEDNSYWFSIEETVMDIFTKTTLSYIDLSIRHKLSKPLAKYLQNYMSGGVPGEQKVKAQTLMILSGTSGRTDDFLRRGLPEALEELKNCGLISSFNIEKNRDGEYIATWNRSAHRTSKWRAG